MNFRDNFGPVSDDQKVPAFEHRIVPLDRPDELEHVAYIEALIKSNLVLPLNFADYSDQVKESVFNALSYIWECPLKILLQDVLNERVANVVEFLEQLLD